MFPAPRLAPHDGVALRARNIRIGGTQDLFGQAIGLMLQRIVHRADFELCLNRKPKRRLAEIPRGRIAGAGMVRAPRQWRGTPGHAVARLRLCNTRSKHGVTLSGYAHTRAP